MSVIPHQPVDLNKAILKRATFQISPDSDNFVDSWRFIRQSETRFDYQARLRGMIKKKLVRSTGENNSSCVKVTEISTGGGTPREHGESRENF